MPRSLVLLAGAALAASGCASGGSAAPAAGADPATPPSASTAAASPTRNSNRNLLLRDELTAAGSNNLHDVITALRPRWLQNTRTGSIPTRGAEGYMTSPGVVVYLNGQLYGDVKTLATIETVTVDRITYLSVPEAQQRYGTRVYAPVIDVRLRSSAP
jgi:hypothetical protein